MLTWLREAQSHVAGQAEADRGSYKVYGSLTLVMLFCRFLRLYLRCQSSTSKETTRCELVPASVHAVP